MATIHRDGTFEFRGDVYWTQRQGPYGSTDDAYEVRRDRDNLDCGTFHRLSDIRAWIDQAEENGWELV